MGTIAGGSRDVIAGSPRSPIRLAELCKFGLAGADARTESRNLYEAELPEPPRVHVDAAAERTACLLTAESGVVTITDP